MNARLLPVAFLLAACSPADAPSPSADNAAEQRIAEAGRLPEREPAPTSAASPPNAAAPVMTTADMSPTDSMPQCRAGLKARGLTDAELEIMLGPMAGVCPNNGVSEGRIREILMTIWTQAGCHQHGPIEVAKALDSGACGGDAG